MRFSACRTSRRNLRPHASLYDAIITCRTPGSHRIAAALLRELPALGVRGAVVNGTDETDWAASPRSPPRALDRAELRAASVGGRQPFPDWQARLRAQLAANPQAAVGEIGLDRWILDRAKPTIRASPACAAHPASVHVQLALAAGQNRAASIHCLDAWGALDDVLRVVRRPWRAFCSMLTAVRPRWCAASPNAALTSPSTALFSIRAKPAPAQPSNSCPPSACSSKPMPRDAAPA